MNKNLKKVISTVAALALSASAVSAFAVNFPDVPEDASYAQAVQELSALKVISGFDDGTFRPDELVTRAQITKMIVDALNETEMAEASKANSQFTDVGDHWAKGYINQGVSDQFIAGYGDGTFGPDDNVTYVQAQKMLVSAIGYETYAQGSGGWPNGYKTWASSQGITDGISGIADDQQLTRAQVAQLVDNAMGAPICVIKDYEVTVDGRRVPNLEIKDDEGKNYQTLFTKKHDAYKVFGRVTKTNKTDSSIDTDKVEFRVEKADNFDDEYIKANSGDEVTDTMYYGDTKAVDYLLTYAEALIQKDDNDEYHIISITPAAATKSVTLAAEDYDKVEGTKLYFYPAGTSRNSTGYKVDVDSDDFAVYINGVDRTDDYDTLAKIGAYIAANDTAAVTLQKQTKIGSTSTTTDYNLVNITSYETAVVKSVTAKTDETIIYFDQYSSNIPKSRMTLDLDDDQRTYDFTLDGATIDPADLQEDDVLSIAFDPTDFDGSSFYDVIVSRDTVDAAKCTSINDTDKEYTFDGTVYKKAAGMDNRVKIEMSATYSLYLDHFGRIAKVSEDTVTKKLGILKNVYKKAGGDYYAQVITKEGTEEEFKVDDGNVTKYQGYLKSAVKTATDGATYNDDNKKSDLYPQQVIEYSVSSSSNKITIKSVYDATAAATDNNGFAEFKASSDKIGSVKLSDTSVIIDLSDIDSKDDYSIISVNGLTDGNDYKAYGYDKSTSGSTFHRLVLITDGTTSFNDETKLAVVRKWSEVDDDDSTKVSYEVAYDGEVQTFVIDEDAVIGGYNEAKDAVAGDVIIFTTNSQGYISKLQKVSNITLGTNYEAGKNAAFAGTLLGTPNKAKFGSDTWNGLLATSNSKDIDIVAGVIGNSHGNNVTIATPVTNVEVVDNEDNTKTKTLAYALDYDKANSEYNYANAVIYTYDFSAGTKNGNSRVSVNDGYIETVSNPAFEYDGKNDTHTYLDLTDEDIAEDIVFAIARVDGDDVLELYLIYAD